MQKRFLNIYRQIMTAVAIIMFALTLSILLVPGSMVWVIFAIIIAMLITLRILDKKVFAKHLECPSCPKPLPPIKDIEYCPYCGNEIE
ncbi:MAG: hypothetical protein FWC69_05820 [Defluviitaleaceae bacterium]|nr:hypothetical protein [Defluviitaleaceae bacterium]